MDTNIRAAFEAMPEPARGGTLQLRDLILNIASETDGVGPMTEALRWGQPAYLTQASKSGTTLRLGVPKTGGFALFVHCQTSLIEDFKASAGHGFQFEGTRAVLFQRLPDIRAEQLAYLIRHALTYHMNKARK